MEHTRRLCWVHCVRLIARLESNVCRCHIPAKEKRETLGRLAREEVEEIQSKSSA
jgi:hypothetical protein